MKRDCFCLCGMLSLLLAMPGVCGEAFTPNENHLSLAPLTGPAPHIDGVITAEKWAGALRISNFVETSSPFLEPRQGCTYVAYDRENLYLAVSSELPPNNKLLSTVTRHNENTVVDDSIEIWLDPNRENKIAGTGDQRYYQLIINDLGTILNYSFDPSKGVPNGAWNLKGYQLKTRINTEAKRWEFELAIPWKALDVDPNGLTHRDIGLLVARNFKYPWVQAPYLPGGGFGDWKKAPVITLRPDAPIVQEQGLGEVFDGVVDYESVIGNAGKEAQTYAIVTTVTPDSMPVVNKAQTLTVPAGGTATYKFSLAKGYLHKEDPFAFLTTLASADGNTVFFHRIFSAKPPREKIWQLPDQTDESTALLIAYHPSTKHLAVKLDLTGMTGGDRVTGASVQVLDAAGKAAFTQDMPMAKLAGEQVFTLPGLDDGRYTVRATLTGGAAAKPFERTFVVQRFPWEQSTLGLSDHVFPPYTPVTTAKDTVNVVLRRYTMNGFGLWNSIIAHGRELLAAPMQVEYTTSAGAGKWSALSGSFTAHKENSATYQATATSPEVVLQTSSIIEEDGCMQVTMTLAPRKAPASLRSLRVDIPLQDAVAPLWDMCISGAIRSNPVGETPAGQGKIWDSTQTGNGAMLPNILPYLWLGGAERGLAFFCDNDKGWIVDGSKPQLTLTRENGRLTLRLWLVNTPAVLDKPRTIIFGLQASPTKPMPADFRTRTDVPMHGGSNGYWGIWPTFAGKYPAQGDYSYVDEMLAERISGRYNGPFLDKWIKEKIQGVSSDKAWIDDRTHHVTAGFGSMAQKGAAPAMLYFEEHYQDQATPEWVAYQDEWGSKAYTQRVWETRPERSGGVSIGFPESYQNFALWHALQWYTRGFGIYSDNTFLHNNYNPAFSSAYAREDGQIQPSSELWHLRAYHRRMWILEQQCQPLTPYPLLNSLHMTNGNMLPIITWSDISLDNEWGWNGATEPFPPDVLRAEMTGLQCGNYPHALYPVFGNNNTPPGLSEDGIARIEWGMRFTHEIIRLDSVYKINLAGIHGQGANGNPEAIIHKFGYGQPDCEVIHYWEASEGTPGRLLPAVNNPNVKWIALWKPAEKRVLITLVNWTKERQAVAITLRGATVAAGKDAESGQPCTPAAITLEGWGVKLVELAVH